MPSHTRRADIILAMAGIANPAFKHLRGARRAGGHAALNLGIGRLTPSDIGIVRTYNREFSRDVIRMQ